MSIGTFGTEFTVASFEVLARRLVCSIGVYRVRKRARTARLTRALPEKLAWHMRIVLLRRGTLGDQEMLYDDFLLLRSEHRLVGARGIFLIGALARTS